LGTYCSWSGVKEAAVKRDIPCLCENIFTVETLEEIDLDEQPLYLCYLKAGEPCPNQKTGVRYQRKNEEGLEFHLHGLWQDSVAAAKVPLAVYKKTLNKFKRCPKGEPFTSLRFRSYLSVQNMALPEGIS
jgi:hypothetical protein